VIEFKELQLTAPGGNITGVIETGTQSLYSSAAIRLKAPDAIPSTPGNFILDHTLSQSDAITKIHAVSQLIKLRRAGATIVILSHDEPLLASCADEIWWLQNGKLMARGDPSEVLAIYRRHVATALRSAGAGQLPEILPTMRQGDGRATLEQIELLGETGDPATVWRSGELATIRVTVRFAAEIPDPVIGIMIRNRIGLNVYGTNTGLEHLKVGPVKAGDALQVSYEFNCNLCPGDYTVTAASHDPDGLWHDWMEDAAAFAVTDTRYTAGVANLRATVAVTTVS
jgi:lipopolysaccharide transport system ATP-binding protein